MKLNWMRRAIGFALPLVLLACSGGSFESQRHALGGTISGLTGEGLVLANGSSTLSVDAGSTSFRMPEDVLMGTRYAISVKTQPAGQTCSVANGSGSMPAAAMLNAVVTCSTNAYTLGGSVSGLTASGLVLANGADTVTVDANATSFTLPSSVAVGSSYDVTVQTQPTGLSCTVTGGSGQMGSANVTSVGVTCSNRAFSVGGSVSGLTTSGLVLANGSDTLSVAANASAFTMPTTVTNGDSYNVTVQTQPSGLTCSVANGSGTVAAADVSNVNLTCAANSYTVGGSISGLTTAGLVVANGSDTLTVAANASSFTLPASVAYGGSYNLTVSTQPTGLTCSIANGSGTMGTSNVTNANLTCAANSYTLGGTITGLTTTGLVLANGSDTLTVAANASQFTMSQSVAYGGSYAVTVQTQPSGLTCTVTSGSGTMGSSDVSSVAVACATAQPQVTTLAGTGSTGSVNGVGTAASFTEPYAVAATSAGVVYVADTYNNLVRKIAADGTVTTLIGTGANASTDGTGTAAAIFRPMGMALDSSGNIYIADLGGNKIRKITASGVVTTFAGSGTAATTNGTGTAASFNGPSAVAIDASGVLYVTELYGQVVRKITTAGVVTTLAGSAGTSGSADGTGTAATFFWPTGIAVDSSGTVFVVESGNYTVRKITAAGVVTTFAGVARTAGDTNGTGTAALFSSPWGMAIDASNNLYVAENGNSKIRKITSAGVVTTFAGTGVQGGTDGAADVATFRNPRGVGVASDGTVYVADTTSSTIRKITQ